jgi:hypothetical protein
METPTMRMLPAANILLRLKGSSVRRVDAVAGRRQQTAFHRLVLVLSRTWLSYRPMPIAFLLASLR